MAHFPQNKVKNKFLMFYHISSKLSTRNAEKGFILGSSWFFVLSKHVLRIGSRGGVKSGLIILKLCVKSA